MTPAELHAWLVARWQEKLDAARAATPGPWDFDAAPDGRWYIDPGPTVDDVGEARLHTDAIHIAAFDPAFSIAVCEAALRRLARHAPDPLGQDSGSPPCGGCEGGYECLDWAPVWPCDEVLDDAAPFAEDNDFPAELKR